MKKNSYKTIEEVPVWILSHELVLSVYRVTMKFPKEETFGLTSQLRRSIASVPANLTEGFYRNSIRELVQFLFVARGSLLEAKYHSKLAFDLKYINESELSLLNKNFDEVGKQLNGWINSLKKRINHRQSTINNQPKKGGERT